MCASSRLQVHEGAGVASVPTLLLRHPVLPHPLPHLRDGGLLSAQTEPFPVPPSPSPQQTNTRRRIQEVFTGFQITFLNSWPIYGVDYEI